MPIDPGDHGLEARAPGKVAWTTRVKIDAGPAERTVEVPPLTDEPAGLAAVPVIAATAAAPAATAAAPPAKSGSTQRVIGWVAIGVGALAVGGGAFFGIQTLSKKSTVDEHCSGPRCDDTGLRANADAKTDATLSTLAFAVGGVAVVTGIVLLLTAPRGAASTTSALGRGLRGVW